MGSKVTVKTVKKAAKELKEAAPAVEQKAPIKEEPKREETKKEKEVLLEKKMRACGCCPVIPLDLPPGQKYFESPDGHLIIGESDRGQVIDRRLNKGKGAWINPMRG